MGPRGCLGLAKGFLFLFNSAAVLLGSLLVAFGLWGLFDRRSLSWVLGSPLLALRVSAWLYLGVGGAAVVLGALGAIGALRGGRVLLGLYFGSLLLLFTAQITVAVIVYTQRVNVASKMAAHAQELIRGYPAQGPPREPHEGWDLVQQQLRCCGWAGPQDWSPPGAVACSCLAPNSTQRTPPEPPHGRCPSAAPQDLFPMGCAEGAQRWLGQNLVTVVGGSLGCGLVELLLLSVSMFLIRNLDPDEPPMAP